MSPEAPSHNLPRRRNGKQQSCEPCRKAKTACDHGIPRCSRCIRKDIGDQCIYHPAPMTGPKGSPGVAKGSRRTDDAASTTSTDAASNLLLLLSQQRSSEAGTVGKNPGRRQSSQFLGPTSYSAVFSEHQASLGGNLLGSNPEEGLGNQVNREQDLEAELGSELLRHGMEVLETLPSQKLCETLLNRYFAVYDAPHHEPSLRYCLQSIFSTYSALQKKPTEPSSLFRISEAILRNSFSPMPAYKTAAEWLQSFSGEHLRLEIVGSFFAIFGLAVATLTEEDPLFTSEQVNQGRRQYTRKLGMAAEKCQALCNETGTSNEFTVWLMHHLQILQSLYSGDDSKTYPATWLCALACLLF